MEVKLEADSVLFDCRDEMTQTFTASKMIRAAVAHLSWMGVSCVTFCNRASMRVNRNGEGSACFMPARLFRILSSFQFSIIVDLDVYHVGFLRCGFRNSSDFFRLPLAR